MNKPKLYFNTKNIIIVVLFALLLTGLRLSWYIHSQPSEGPAIVNGVLDLTEWNSADSKPLLLNGDWEFYPGQLISDSKDAVPESSRYISVPADWKNDNGSETSNSYGAGTYRLRIMVNQQHGESYAFWFHKVSSASRVIINGNVAAEFGTNSLNEKNFKSKVLSYTASYHVPEENRDSSEIDIWVQVSNFAHPTKGGITYPIEFGTQASIDSKRWFSIGYQFFTIVIMLLHMIYAIILFLFRPKQLEFILFASLLLCTAIAIAADNDNLLVQLIPLNYTWFVKIRIISYLLISTFILSLAQSFFKQYTRLCNYLYITIGLYAGSLLFLPVSAVLHTVPLFLALFNIQLAVAIVMIIKMKLRQLPDTIFLGMAVLAILLGCLWTILQNTTQSLTTFYPFDMIAALVCFSTYWFKRYFRNSMEKAQYAEKLERNDRLKDEFLANTSHELRTPLHGIINIAETIINSEKGSLQMESLQDMNLLIKIGRRMSSLLNDLLDLTRLQEKQIVLQKESVRIQSVAAGVIDMLKFLVEGRPIRFRMDIPEAFPPVWADEKRIVQIMFNLLHNAIKYTEQGEIVIRATTYGDRASIHVQDPGKGMDEDTRARVFRRYEQGSQETNGAGGLGLGLHISLQLVELHGGTFNVKSAVGVGSDFSFTLPLSNEKASILALRDLPLDEIAATLPDISSKEIVPTFGTSESPGRKELHSTEKMNILAVDDDPINLEVLLRILASEQYDIVTAQSGKQALELLPGRSWNLVIADVMMPQMSGYELTRRIRERFTLAELPILLLTARSQPEDIYNGFMAGASDYVSKPVNAIELQYRVSSLASLKQSFNNHLRMEAAYLQAQIQPHFLFNTLNSLMALSEIDTEKMRKLGDAFSSYLRYSFHFVNLQKLVPLLHELELVNAYLYIEQERFGSRINIKRNIQSGLVLHIPPLTLQPLVENAVRHGLLSQKHGGILSITIERRSGGVYFEVRDNGKGIPPEVASKLLDYTSPTKGGIGLKNTNRRLTQLYDSGLKISSHTGGGTTVSFFIPHEFIHAHQHK